jgi:hypothetical protein
MSERSAHAGVGVRVILCALAVGLLFAVALGVWSEGGGRVDQTGSYAEARTGFAPGLAGLGFLAGALLGATVGIIWGRRGLGSLIGFGLVACFGALVGMVAAGLLGAETRISVTANTSEVEHGPRPIVLAIGAALGLLLGSLVAWRFSPARDGAAEARPG